MTGWSKLLRAAHKVRHDNDLTCQETAEILENVADHYRWYGKQKFNEQVKKSLKEG